MNASDIRQSKRRACERRANERRLIHFVFGSAEWRQNIEQQYLMWPLVDRRVLERRKLERRSIARRKVAKAFNSRRKKIIENQVSEILNKDEKEMLASLFRLH